MRLQPARCCLAVVLAAALAGPAWAAEDAGPFREATFQGGSLRYLNDLPVLTVEGTPPAIGRQEAELTSTAARAIMAYPQDLLAAIGREDRWSRILQLGRSLWPQLPHDHREELEAFARQSGIDHDLLLGVNVMVDTYRGGFGCSSLIVEPQRSATGEPLFGRNLDFFTLGLLQKYSLLVIYRPEGKHAFASVGFPGMLGCFTGMNDSGLAVAVHEVFFSRDGSAMFNPRGTPYTMLFRRVLEECTTVEEAEKLLRGQPRTTMLNLAVCDTRHAAVFELTPRTVAVRRPEGGILACTNHFRTEPLATFRLSPRYHKLMQSARLERIGLEEVAAKLDQVNLGRLTLQTMIFEPASLRLHLAIGSCPASALPLKRVDLAPLFGRELTEADEGAPR